MRGIALLKGDTSIEAGKVTIHCNLRNIPIVRLNKNEPLPEQYTPCGSVEWCLSLLEKKVVPDYYPEWLNAHLHRKVWYEAKWPLNTTCFIKPADKYKRFTGFIHEAGSYKKKKRNGKYWCSEVVEFVNEWRYYVANGKVLCGKWYWGDEVNTPDAPGLTIEIPEGYCGALDFGMLKEGELALVEAQHPFACGWYGSGLDDIELYLKWLESGWHYMNK